MPVIGFATTEMATVVHNGFNGYVYTDIHEIITRMKQLIHSPALAKKLGDNARRYALKRFSIRRFVSDWNNAFALVTEHASPLVELVA